MTTKKPSPIVEHKEKDVKLMREILLSIINDKEVPKKECIEASKLLLRAHHALQVDRSVTAKAVAQQAQRVDNVLSKEEDEELQRLIDA